MSVYGFFQGKFVKNKDTKEERDSILVAWSYITQIHQKWKKWEMRNKRRDLVNPLGRTNAEGMFLYRNFHNLPRHSDQHGIKNEAKRMCFQNPVGEGIPTVIWRSCQ